MHHIQLNLSNDEEEVVEFKKIVDNSIRDVLYIKPLNQYYVKQKKLRKTIYGDACLYVKGLLVDTSSLTIVPNGDKIVVKRNIRELVENKKMADGRRVLEDPEKEAFILTELLKDRRHRNVIEMVGYFKSKAFTYSIFPYINGGELFDFIAQFANKNVSTIKPSGVPENICRVILQDIAKGLLHLHQHNVIHYDISPENVLLQRSQNQITAIVIDLGLSRILEHGKTYFDKGIVCGKKKYMAPEVFDKSQPLLGEPVDVFSLGSTFFVMLFGVPLFDYPSAKLSKQFKYACLKLRLKDLLKTWNFLASDNAIDLLQRMLIADPLQRIKLIDVLKHPFLTTIVTS